MSKTKHICDFCHEESIINTEKYNACKECDFKITSIIVQKECSLELALRSMKINKQEGEEIIKPTKTFRCSKFEHKKGAGE